MTPTTPPPGRDREAVALAKINAIRNSIIGLQTINWSEHIYPLVAALDAAGIEGMEYPEACENFGTMLERTNAAEDEATRLRAENESLRAERDAAIARAEEAEKRATEMERGKAAAMGLQHGGSIIIRQLEDRVATLTADLVQVKAQAAGMREALETIKRKSKGWVMREDLKLEDVVVQDDGQHYKVLVLQEHGLIAHRALTTPELPHAD